MLQFLHSAIYNADHFRDTFSLASIEEEVKSLSYQYTHIFGGLDSGSVKWDQCDLFYRGSAGNMLSHSNYSLHICRVVKGLDALHVILEDGSYRLLDFSLQNHHFTWQYQLCEALKFQRELSPYHLKLARLEDEIERLRVMMGE
jgi:hypothetical protein